MGVALTYVTQGDDVTAPGAYLEGILDFGNVSRKAGFGDFLVTVVITQAASGSAVHGYDFTWTVANMNRAPSIAHLRLVNLSRPGEAPRTKHIMQVIAENITDPDGDPVSLRLEWRVNGLHGTYSTVMQVPAQGVTKVNFDLGLPGLGNVGETITVIATPSDGQNYGEAQYAETTMANTPPVVTSILVEEVYQAFEDGVYYFLVGQRVAIHVLVSDDDMDVNQGNDELRLQIGGELPPAVDGWYISEYRNGEFFLEATLADHGDPYEATKYYTINFCAVDRFDEGDPPLVPAVTSPTVTGVMVIPPAGVPGLGTEVSPFIVSPALGWLSFNVRFTGVGFSTLFMGAIWYAVYDDDPVCNDRLHPDTWVPVRPVPVGGVFHGHWEAVDSFSLLGLPNGDLQGAAGGSGSGGTCEGYVKELFLYIWWNVAGVSSAPRSTTTSVFYVQVTP